MPRIRQNIVTGEWVVVAPERAKRPEELSKHPFAQNLVHDQKCHFCVGGEVWKERIAGASTRHTYTIPNKFPAFTPQDTIEETGHKFYLDNASVGVHEVIVMTSGKDSLDQASPHHLAELLTAMQNRAREYENDVNIRSFTPIYNHGILSGATVAHPHAQFFGNALVPPRLAHEFFGAEQYFHQHKACVFCDLISFELKEDVRVIFKNAGAIVTSAYAPRFPLETWIIPTDHHSNFVQASVKSIASVAGALHFTALQLAKKLENPSLNWYIHTARSFDYHQKLSYHWHLEVAPRLSTYGGYELGTDMTIETVLPEIAAQFLRS